MTTYIYSLGRRISDLLLEYHPVAMFHLVQQVHNGEVPQLWTQQRIDTLFVHLNNVRSEAVYQGMAYFDVSNPLSFFVFIF